MKIILVLVLCFLSINANAQMESFKASEPMSPQESREFRIRTFNTEVSRNLIHMSHGNWSDKIVKAHATPEFSEEYISGEFLQYVPYGQLMSFEGVYHISEGEDGKTTVKAIAAFELQKVDVEITYKLVEGRYLINDIIITPMGLNNQKLDGVVC